MRFYVWCRHLGLLADATRTTDDVHYTVGQVHAREGGVRGGAWLIQHLQHLTTSLKAAQKWRAHNHLDVLQDGESDGGNGQCVTVCVCVCVMCVCVCVMCVCVCVCVCV